jgi:hypothetical protein
VGREAVGKSQKRHYNGAQRTALAASISDAFALKFKIYAFVGITGNGNTLGIAIDRG